jgi:hypothetical protein
LNGYYQNNYKASKQLEFNKFVYNNSYDLSTVKMHLGAAVFSTSVATTALMSVNPVLGLLSLYDWYLLGRFSFGILNRTLH